VVAITDAATPEVTLRLTDNAGKEAHLNGPVMQGSQIRFEGVVAAFTKEPFMLTLEVSKISIHWHHIWRLLVSQTLTEPPSVLP
jgi:hypothetical protein